MKPTVPGVKQIKPYYDNISFPVIAGVSMFLMRRKVEIPIKQTVEIIGITGATPPMCHGKIS